MTPACLLIANDVAPGFDADFEAWYQRQHVDERLAVPGFLTARRYRAVEASHAFVALYELTEPEVLTSEAYRERLDNPTPWTRRVMPGFRRMNRTLMSRTQDIGRGMGTLMDLVVVDEAQAPTALPPLSASVWAEHPAFERARFLEACPQAPSVAGSQEASLRPGGDASYGRAWIVEWADLDEHPGPDARAVFERTGVPVKWDEGGRYRLVNARSAPIPV